MPCLYKATQLCIAVSRIHAQETWRIGGLSTQIGGRGVTITWRFATLLTERGRKKITRPGVIFLQKSGVLFVSPHNQNCRSFCSEGSDFWIWA